MTETSAEEAAWPELGVPRLPGRADPKDWVPEAEAKKQRASFNPHNDSPFEPGAPEAGEPVPHARDDEFGRDYLADQVVDMIKASTPPFTIAVYGPWGEGKTHLMKRVQEKVETPVTADPDPPDAVRTVWFDLWRHQFDVDPVVAMLQTAADRAKKKKWRDVDSFEAKLDKAMDGLGKALWLTAFDTAAGLAGGLAPAAGTTVSPAGMAPPALGLFGKSLPARLREVRAERRHVLDEQVQLRNRFLDVLDLLAGENGRVVFFIDDLDRCLPAQIVAVLERIKLFMDSPKCVFVLGADEGAVRAAIGEARAHLDQVADRYLDKMVQCAFELPPVADDARRQYAAHLLDRVSDTGLLGGRVGEVSYSPPECATRRAVIVDLWDAAFRETHATVRMMVRTANGFGVDHAIGYGYEPVPADEVRRWKGEGEWARPRIADYKPWVMAVFSVLKTCYHDVYTHLREDVLTRKDVLERLFTVMNADPAGGSPTKVEAYERAQAGELRLLDYFGQRKTFITEVRMTKVRVLGKSPLSGEELERYFVLGGGAGPVGVETEAAGVEDHAPAPQAGTAAPASPDQAPRPGLTRKATDRQPPTPKTDIAQAQAQIELLLTRPLSERLKCEPDGLPHVGPYRWIPVAVRSDEHGREALLLTKYVVDTRPYHGTDTDVTWEVCDLRRYLNSEFLRGLGEDVWPFVRTHRLENPDNRHRPRSGGNPTDDRVFLLSVDEVVDYVLERDTDAAAQLEEQGYTDPSYRLVATDVHGARAWWWLRSPGGLPGLAASVSTDGTLRGFWHGSPVSAVGGVRPALWLNLES